MCIDAALLGACNGGSAGTDRAATGAGSEAAGAGDVAPRVRTYANPDAFDPLPSFRAAPLPPSGRFADRLERTGAMWSDGRDVVRASFYAVGEDWAGASAGAG